MNKQKEKYGGIIKYIFYNGEVLNVKENNSISCNNYSYGFNTSFSFS